MMKKAVFALFLICASSIAFSQITVFEDDFEYYTPRKFPSLNWNPWHNCSSQPVYNIVSSLISDSSNLPYPLSEYRAVAFTSGDGKGWGDNLKITNTSIPLKVGIAASGNLLVYPNPVRERLTIESNFSRKSILHIFNSLGQIVYREEIFAEHLTINTSSWQDGIYYLVMKDFKGTTLHSEKILKE